ncbi:hypothetical protein BV25DRAFT_977821 [Artomyces pyxidatus]|uniref:Uncharacterized protein n=1 Tax=Artomyces pyxidatus TaxID=48021 RepID=A0ACB8SVB7_9AGAM|nr:hypothetical protein BV25DRAFT_977821 [Artomyces pyxidatus]
MPYPSDMTSSIPHDVLNCQSIPWPVSPVTSAPSSRSCSLQSIVRQTRRLRNQSKVDEALSCVRLTVALGCADKDVGGAVGRDSECGRRVIAPRQPREDEPPSKSCNEGVVAAHIYPRASCTNQVLCVVCEHTPAVCTLATHTRGVSARRS